MAWRSWSASPSRSTSSSASSRGESPPASALLSDRPSINCLFWQLGWLQRNLRRASPETLLTVAAVVAVCVALLLPEELLGLAADQLGALLGVPAELLLRLLRWASPTKRSPDLSQDAAAGAGGRGAGSPPAAALFAPRARAPPGGRQGRPAGRLGAAPALLARLVRPPFAPS